MLFHGDVVLFCEIDVNFHVFSRPQSNPIVCFTTGRTDGYWIKDARKEGGIDYLSPKNFHLIEPNEFNSKYDEYFEDKKTYSGLHSTYKPSLLKWVRVQVWVPVYWD